jgi:hypothetical protein
MFLILTFLAWLMLWIFFAMRDNCDYIVNQGLQESPHVLDPRILGLAHALDLLRDEGQL